MTTQTESIESPVETREGIFSGRFARRAIPTGGVELRGFVSREGGATGFSTGTATFEPGSELPYHTHGYSEVVIVLNGKAVAAAEGRTYRLAPYDCVHIPVGIAHRVDPVAGYPLVALYAFASATPAKEFVPDSFRVTDCGYGQPKQKDPEFVSRFASDDVHEHSEGAFPGSVRGACRGGGYLWRIRPVPPRRFIALPFPYVQRIDSDRFRCGSLRGGRKALRTQRP